MLVRRVRFTVEIDMDSVPGWGNNPKDFSDYTLKLLKETVGHYNPTVTNAEVIEDHQVVDEYGTVVFQGTFKNCEKFVSYSAPTFPLAIKSV